MLSGLLFEIMAGTSVPHLLQVHTTEAVRLLPLPQDSRPTYLISSLQPYKGGSVSGAKLGYHLAVGQAPPVVKVQQTLLQVVGLGAAGPSGHYLVGKSLPCEAAVVAKGLKLPSGSSSQQTVAGTATFR